MFSLCSKIDWLKAAATQLTWHCSVLLQTPSTSSAVLFNNFFHSIFHFYILLNTPSYLSSYYFFILALHDLSKTPSSCFSSNLFFLLLVLLITNFFFLVNFLIYFYMNGVPVILSFRARNKNCVERLRTLHPDNFSSFRILSSQRILSGHLILIPSALRNYSIMGHYSPGTISFLQILRQDCPTIGKSKSVFKYCSETFKDNSANCWYFVAQGDLRRFYQVLLH